MQPNHSTDTKPQRELTSGRKFSAEQLQLLLLQLLSEAPAHGYELIKRLKELSENYYRPSPGVLYPALAQLEALGLADVETIGRRKKYHLTTCGQMFLQEHSGQAQELFAILKHAAKKMLWLKHISNNPNTATTATGWLPEYVQARQALQTALLSQNEDCPDEQLRIAQILQRAVRDILQQH